MAVASLPVPAVAGIRKMGQGTSLPCIVQHSLCIRRKQQRFDALSGIHGAAAAQRDQAVAVLSEIQIAPGGTVLKVRVGMIASKYGVRNRAEAVVQAFQLTAGADGHGFMNAELFKHFGQVAKGTRAAAKLLYHENHRLLFIGCFYSIAHLK